MPAENTADRLHTLAKNFNINSDKPHFPVNTMRLCYLILTDELTNQNQDALNQVNQVIPKISAILDARDLALASKKDQENPPASYEFDQCSSQIETLLKDVNTPQLHQTIQILFSDIYPLQESLLHVIDKNLRQERLHIADLYATLRIRSMDSLLYAGVIDQILVEYVSHEGTDKADLTPLYTRINACLQINDIVDAIIYAKQDLASKSATIVEVIKRIDNSTTGIDNTLHSVFTYLKNLAVDPKATTSTQFIDKLIAVIGMDLSKQAEPAQNLPQNPQQT